MSKEPRLVNPGPIAGGLLSWVLAVFFSAISYDTARELFGTTLPVSTAVARVISLELTGVVALVYAVLGTGFIWIGWTWTRRGGPGR